jgi:hypothetical protein
MAQATACGMPHGSPIYFAVDFDATPAQQVPINAYLTGAASVLGKTCVGVYGSYYVCKRPRRRGLQLRLADLRLVRRPLGPRSQLHQYRNGMKLPGSPATTTRR